MLKSLFIRTLNNGSIQHRNWLIYSESANALFCEPCKLFGRHSHSICDQGFDDWSNVHRNLQAHKNTMEHKNNCVIYLNRAKSQITKHLEDEIISEMQYWRRILHRLVTVIKYLSSRGLPFRGHDQIFGSNTNGNYNTCLEMISEYDPFLQEHIMKYGHVGTGNVFYRSNTTCEEFIKLLAEAVLKLTLIALQVAKYYSYYIYI